MRLPRNVVTDMAERIAPHDTADARTAYRDAGLSDERYRWDLASATLGASYICNLYTVHNVTDDHIDTALRRIVAPLTTDGRR